MCSAGSIHMLLWPGLKPSGRLPTMGMAGSCVGGRGVSSAAEATNGERAATRRPTTTAAVRRFGRRVAACDSRSAGAGTADTPDVLIVPGVPSLLPLRSRTELQRQWVSTDERARSVAFFCLDQQERPRSARMSQRELIWGLPSSQALTKSPTRKAVVHEF